MNNSWGLHFCFCPTLLVWFIRLSFPLRPLPPPLFTFLQHPTIKFWMNLLGKITQTWWRSDQMLHWKTTDWLNLTKKKKNFFEELQMCIWNNSGMLQYGKLMTILGEPFEINFITFFNILILFYKMHLTMIIKMFWLFLKVMLLSFKNKK